MATIGYILSPLSWWNDLYVNVPIAYVLAWAVHHVDKRLFGWALVLFYWLSNLVGLLMLHHGISMTVAPDERASLKSNIMTDVLLSIVYSAALALLVYFGIIRLPEDYFKQG